MRPIPCWSAAVLAALFAADGRCQDAAAWDRGYAGVRELMQKGKWSDARAALVQLLQQHAKQPYAIADRQAIVEDHQQCSFWCQAQVPKAQEVITGKVETWDAGSGRLKVRYEASDLSDWEEVRVDHYLHPAVFRGAYTVTVSGPEYPAGGMVLWFDLDGATYGKASFGSGDDKPAVRQFDGDRELGAVVAKAAAPARRGPFVAQLRVSARNVELLLDKKSLLTAPRGPGDAGQVLLVGRCGDVLLEGAVEPSWFQGCVDELLAAQREDFADEYRAERELPDWLFGSYDVPHTAARHEFVLAERAHGERGEELVQLLDEGKLGDALALLGKLGDADVAAADRSYLTALLQQRLGDAEAALPLVQQALAATPQPTWLRVLEGQVLFDLGQAATALAKLLAAHRDDPGSEPALQAAFVALLRTGDVAGAERLVREAKCKHGLWEEAYDLDRMLAMRRRGPAWARRFEASSAHYEVHSDIDARICAAACRVLEESHDNLCRRFGVQPAAAAARFPVYLFAGESGYQEYNDAILGHAVPHSAGLYSPVLKQLLIWNVPRRDDMVQTIRHEGLHQFLDRLMADPPVWFNEGLAEYWENARRDNGKLVGGQPQARHLATLQRQQKELPKLKEFVYGGRADFYAHAQLRYAQGWALVHFLLEGPAANRRRFDALWQALLGGSSGRKAALDAAFADADWAVLERDFGAWIGKLAAAK